MIIGGRNGGEAGYRGLVDEIAIWNVAADGEYIAKLAAGQSPLDDDGDGLFDTKKDFTRRIKSRDGIGTLQAALTQNEFLVNQSNSQPDTELQ